MSEFDFEYLRPAESKPLALAGVYVPPTSRVAVVLHVRPMTAANADYIAAIMEHAGTPDEIPAQRTRRIATISARCIAGWDGIPGEFSQARCLAFLLALVEAGRADLVHEIWQFGHQIDNFLGEAPASGND